MDTKFNTDQDRIDYAYNYLGYAGCGDLAKYFTVANMKIMFGADAITDQSVLDQIRDAINADCR